MTAKVLELVSNLDVKSRTVEFGQMEFTVILKIVGEEKA